MARSGFVLILLLACALSHGATWRADGAPDHAQQGYRTAALRLASAHGSWALRARDGHVPPVPEVLLASATCPRCPLEPCRVAIALRPVPCRST